MSEKPKADTFNETDRSEKVKADTFIGMCVF